MFDKQIWKEMTDSQREFVKLGIQIERERITKLLLALDVSPDLIEQIEK